MLLQFTSPIYLRQIKKIKHISSFLRQPVFIIILITTFKKIQVKIQNYKEKNFRTYQPLFFFPRELSLDKTSASHFLRFCLDLRLVKSWTKITPEINNWTKKYLKKLMKLWILFLTNKEQYKDLKKIILNRK